MLTQRSLLQILKKRLPIVTWLPDYTLGKFSRDLIAGFSVALTEIPQGIAYATIAGLSPEYGLYSGLVGGFIYLVFGSCKDLNIGPTSILALMLQSHVAALGPGVAILMTFISGILILAMGLLHLGFLIDFFSYPVIAGFTSAASLQIGSAQLKNLLGIPGQANEFLESWESVFDNLNQVKKWDSILGIVSIVILIGLREIRVFGSLKFRPEWSKQRNIASLAIYVVSLARNALVVIVATVIAFCLREDNLFKLTGDVKGGFPPFSPPEFSFEFNNTTYDFPAISQELSLSIIFIPLVAILETVSIAKSFANGKTVDATQELIALGLCNLVASFVRSMPVTGSFSRTAINNASGVKTTVSGSISAMTVIIAIALLTKTFYFIPKAALAAVIISSMIYLFEYRAFINLWKNKKLDLVPLLVTFLCGLFLSLEYGILIGICVNLFFVLYSSARPKMAVIEEKIARPSGGKFKFLVYTPRGALHFPAAEYLRDTILACEDQSAVVVIDGEFLRSVDFTIARSFVVSSQEFHKQRRKIVFLNFKEAVKGICLGIDRATENFFKNGDLESVAMEIDFVEEA